MVKTIKEKKKKRHQGNDKHKIQGSNYLWEGGKESHLKIAHKKIQNYWSLS